MTDPVLKRNSDTEICNLIYRVEQLEIDVKNFREEFERHEDDEHRKLEVLQISLATIQAKIDQLLIDIKEPIETYKTAKAGFTFLKFVSETAKWVVPLAVGLWIGYGGLSITQPDQKPPTTKEVQK